MTTNINNVLLLHPHLLSNHQLLEVLTMRCIKIENPERTERSELLDLYRRVVIPLEQRNRPGTSQVVTETSAGLENLKLEAECVIPKRKIRINHSSNMHPESIKKVKLQEETNGCVKRKLMDVEINSTKKQKITWP